MSVHSNNASTRAPGKPALLLPVAATHVGWKDRGYVGKEVAQARRWARLGLQARQLGVEEGRRSQDQVVSATRLFLSVVTGSSRKGAWTACAPRFPSVSGRTALSQAGVCFSSALRGSSHAGSPESTQPRVLRGATPCAVSRQLGNG